MHPNVLVCISSVSSNVIAYNSKIPTVEKCPSLLWLIRHNCKLCVRSQGTHPGYVSLNGIGRTVKHEIILTGTTLLFMHGYKWFTIWARVNQYLTMHRYHAKMAKSKLHAKVLVCIVYVPSKVIAYNRKIAWAAWCLALIWLIRHNCKRVRYQGNHAWFDSADREIHYSNFFALNYLNVYHAVIYACLQLSSANASWAMEQ